MNPLIEAPLGSAIIVRQPNDEIALAQSHQPVQVSYTTSSDYAASPFLADHKMGQANRKHFRREIGIKEAYQRLAERGQE